MADNKRRGEWDDTADDWGGGHRVWKRHRDGYWQWTDWWAGQDWKPTGGNGGRLLP